MRRCPLKTGYLRFLILRLLLIHRDALLLNNFLFLSLQSAAVFLHNLKFDSKQLSLFLIIFYCKVLNNIISILHDLDD